MSLLARLGRIRYPYLWLFLFSLLLNGAITAMTGVPGPETHDEFSYLLAADTFAHGRLTNPPHPLWEHFESFHILQRPTYQSKYQPGQGLILALGEVVTGLPIAGAWLAGALAAVAIAWGLRAYLPARWAYLGGVLVSLHPLMLLWSQNYWGGALTAVGGALVFGATGRLRREASAGMAAVLALGVAVLFNTRPYEGSVLILFAVTPLLLFYRAWWTPKVAGTFIACLAASACWTGYYDYRVTGDPFQLPYLLHEQQYALAPPFVWQNELSAKTYRHEALREYNEGVELPHYRAQRTPAGFIRGVGDKLGILLKSYGAEPVLAVALLGLPFVLRRRWAVRRTGIMLVCFVCALFLSNWTFPHYAAPGFVLMVFLVVESLRPLAARRRYFLPLFLAVYLGTTAWWVVHRVRTYPQSWGRMRQTLVAELEANPGEDLVIVRYEPGRNINTEWVYNPADIDRAPVVFARDMGPARNRELLEHFKGRTVWLLDVGPEGARIEPYGSTG
jgi:hypothetical protein